MITQSIFVSIVGAVFLERLWEVFISRHNDAHILAQGGRDRTSGTISKLTIVLQLSWFVSMLVEVFWLERPYIPTLAVGALIVAIAGQYLRYLSIQALAERWTIRIVTLPGVPVIDQGIYRYLRHPNYLGIMLETPAVPLVHGAYLTAIFYTVVNAFFVYLKIRAEEHALTEDNNYASVFKDRPRFIPWNLIKTLNSNSKEVETL